MQPSYLDYDCHIFRLGFFDVYKKGSRPLFNPCTLVMAWQDQPRWLLFWWSFFSQCKNDPNYTRKALHKIFREYQQKKDIINSVQLIDKHEISHVGKPIMRFLDLNYDIYQRDLIQRKWPVPGYKHLNLKDKPREGAGTYGSCRGIRCARTHSGIDIQAPIGAKIVAYKYGKVVDLKPYPNPSKTYGKQVVIDHGSGIFSQSAHLDTILVKPGQIVQAGQIIGTIGRSGNTPPTGDPHLHFEIRLGSKKPRVDGGKVDNPMNYLPIQ